MYFCLVKKIFLNRFIKFVLGAFGDEGVFPFFKEGWSGCFFGSKL